MKKLLNHLVVMVPLQKLEFIMEQFCFLKMLLNNQYKQLLLHLKEFPLRKVMVYMYGPTSGTSSFNGFTGKGIASYQDLDVANYNIQYI